MNWVDMILVLVLLLAARSGWKKGFIHSIADLFTWIGSIIAGLLLYAWVATEIEKLINLDAWLLPTAFLITVISSRILMGLISKLILRSLPPKLSEDPVNKALGIIPGILHGLVYATVLAALLLALPLKRSIVIETQKSRVAQTLAVQAQWANKRLAPVFDEAVRQTMGALSTGNAEHKETLLHFTYEDPKARPDLEAQMLELINAERAKEGLKPLKADPVEAAVGRAHSKDMFARGYFAHVNPDGKNPFDRMKAAHIDFTIAGENLALAQTLEIAHNNLMKSPGHRANIMNPSFGRVGIGIMDGGFYGLMISQEFRN